MKILDYVFRIYLLDVDGTFILITEWKTLKLELHDLSKRLKSHVILMVEIIAIKN